MKTALMVMIGRGGDGNVVKEGLTGRMKHDQERMRWEGGGWTIGVAKAPKGGTSGSEA